jgi:hypothetical protein
MVFSIIIIIILGGVGGGGGGLLLSYNLFFILDFGFILNGRKKKKSVEDILHVLIIFCLECLESDRVLLFSERHTLLRVLPVLVVLATSGEKEGESIFKKIKIPRLLSIFKVTYNLHIIYGFLFIYLFIFLNFLDSFENRFI